MPNLGPMDRPQAALVPFWSPYPQASLHVEFRCPQSQPAENDWGTKRGPE